MKDRDDSARREKASPRQAGEGLILEGVSPETTPPAEAHSQEDHTYRVLVESAPVGIAIIDSQGRYQYLNPKFVGLFGYTLDDLPTAQEWFTKAYPDKPYRQQVIAEWQLYLQESQGGEAEPRTFTVTCKDGSAKVIKFRAVPLEGGGQFVSSEDVTELRQAEDSLRVSENRFRLVQECAGDAFFVHDAGRILEVNQQACDSLGYSREELVGMSLFDIEVGISPGELAEAWRQDLAGPRTVQGLHRRKDGSTFPVEVKASHFEHRGQKVRLGLARDLTPRLEAEVALKDSELKYRTLVEQIPAITYMTDLDDFITTNYISPQVESILGFTPADFEAEPYTWANHLHPEDRDHVFAESARCLETRKPFVGEYRMMARDGRVVWLRDQAQVVKDASGRHLFLQGVRLDVTERRELEAALQESEAHYRTLFETSPDAILLFDAGLKLIRANSAAASLYGVEKAEEIVGRSAFEFVAPESLAAAQKFDQESQDQENYLEAEFVLRKKDGTPFLAETRTSVLRNPDGSPQGFLAVAKDITARKRAEEKIVRAKEEWELTFDAISDLVMILDDQHRIVRVNRAIAQRFGSRPEEMVGKFCYQALYGLEAPHFYCPYTSLLADGKPFQKEVWDEELKSHFLISMSPIHDPSGKVVGSVQVGTDITELKSAEAALRKSEENYRLLVGQIPAVVFKGFEDWSIECFDDKMETLTGYSKEDFNSRRVLWRDLIPAEELPYVKQVFREALQGDGSYFREHRIRKKSGEQAWVQCRGQIFMDDKGAVDHISGVTFDITAQKQAEMARQESEAKYRLIADNVSDVIWTTTLDLQISYISPSVQQLLGFSPEEIMGKRVGELFSPPSLAVALEVLSKEMAREGEGGVDLTRTRTLEVEQRHQDGSLVWTELNASFIRDANHQPIGILGVTRDITKRKQAEQALQRREAILEAVNFAAEKFLKTDSWEQDIQEVLERLGRGLQMSRIFIFENHSDKNGVLLTSLRYEWFGANLKPEIDTPQFQAISYEAVGFGRWAEMLGQGQIISGHARDLPPSERKLLDAHGVKSILAVPIFVDHQWWGGIGFEECFQEREWFPMEVDALLAAASILGLTILHQQEQADLRESEEKLRSMSYQMMTSQEQERKRFSAELHDVLGHELLILKLEMENLEDELEPEKASQKQKLTWVIQRLKDSIASLRGLCQDLGPVGLEDLGLTKALQYLTENFARAKKLSLNMDLDDIDQLFSLPVETTIYRVVQEALTNIGKHAEATHILLQIRKRGRRVSFTIEDDGKGLDPAVLLQASRTLGILSMEQRIKIMQGSFDIFVLETGGTRISFTIPLDEE